MRKKIGAFILSAGMIFTLASCSLESGDIAEGTWVLKSASSGSTEVTQEQLQAEKIGDTTFTFKEGKVEITMPSSDEVGEGTYTVDGDKVTISADGETDTYSGTIKDGQLTIMQGDSEDLKLIFEKK